MTLYLWMKIKKIAMLRAGAQWTGILWKPYVSI